MKTAKPIVILPLLAAFLSLTTLFVDAQNSGSQAHDPGVGAGSIGAGQPLSQLSSSQMQFFQDGQTRFSQIDSVSGTLAGEPGRGLGPTFNSNSCGSCHAQPSVGGTSPSTLEFPNLGPNPQIQAAFDAGADNAIPFFITSDGPVRGSFSAFPSLLGVATGLARHRMVASTTCSRSRAGPMHPTAIFPSRILSACTS